jgi:adenine-specific DNA-methyltransferase
MARKTKSEQKPIENYTHTDKERVNNPPVGLVTPKTDPDSGTISLPFAKAPKIAVKIIDDRGIESLRVIKL